MFSDFGGKIAAAFFTALLCSLIYTVIAYNPASEIFTFGQLMFIVFILSFFPTFIGGVFIGSYIDHFMFDSPQYWICYMLLGVLFAYVLNMSLFYKNGENLILLLSYGIICAVLYATLRFVRLYYIRKTLKPKDSY